MTVRSLLLDWLEPIYERHPQVRDTLRMSDATLDRVKGSAARWFPQLIRPEPRSLFIALTANCNLHCQGCRYGRDFMPGQQLSWAMVRNLLDDAKALGFDRVRLYGGEPLLHKDLPRIVEHAARLGLRFWITTNGILLREHIDALFNAGLRRVTVGFYGVGEDYDNYVQRPERFARMEAGVSYARDRYGMDISMALDWLLMRPTCNLNSLHETWRFAERYQMPIHVNLIHYSLPYFTEGQDHELQFRPHDRPAIESVVGELLRLKDVRPELVIQHAIALRAIPDWLLKGPNMRVPCHSYRLIWVGADGTVQLCYVTFKLGNLHEKRLADMLFTPEHRQSARDAFSLNCPNCHCGYDKRTLSHGPSRRLYNVTSSGPH
ncbi:MAG: radical SAM/SPASM domain-containing protein [Candidatus Entotheonellia bacterium]